MSKRKSKNGPSSTQKRSKGSEFDSDTVHTCWEGSGGTQEVIHILIGVPFVPLWTVVVIDCKWSQMVANGRKRYQTNRFTQFTHIYSPFIRILDGHLHICLLFTHTHIWYPLEHILTVIYKPAHRRQEYCSLYKSLDQLRRPWRQE